MIQEITIMESNKAKNEFIKLRQKVDDIIVKTPRRKLDEEFAEEFRRIYTEATLGDIVCQDYLGYIFKRGKEGLVPENIELSMQWQLLAASNGNNFSIDRLAIFLNSAYDEIINLEDFGEIKYYNKINQINYTYKIGRLICDAIIDILQINALNIIKEIPDTLEFNQASMRVYDNARQKAVSIVINYLRSFSPKHQSDTKEMLENESEINAQKEDNLSELNTSKQKFTLIEKIFSKKSKK